MAGAAFATTPITYNVNQTIGTGSVTGTITTDGMTGTLATVDFLDWSLTLTGAGGATYILTPSATDVVYSQGSDVFASPTQITFNYSGSDNGILLFQDGLFSGNHYWCNATQSGTCFQGATVAPLSIFDPSAQNVPASGIQVIATVATGAIPELSTWVLLLFGFGALAFGAHRQTAKARLATRVH